MKNVNTSELRAVSGGATIECDYCGKSFKYSGWWKGLLALIKVRQHQRSCYMRNG